MNTVRRIISTLILLLMVTVLALGSMAAGATFEEDFDPETEVETPFDILPKRLFRH